MTLRPFLTVSLPEQRLKRGLRLGTGCSVWVLGFAEGLFQEQHEAQAELLAPGHRGHLKANRQPFGAPQRLSGPSEDVTSM